MKTVIHGQVPSKSNGYRIGKGFMYKSKALIDYENSFYLQCLEYRDRNIEGFFEFYADIYFQSNRSDLDNAIKVLLDILQKKVKAIKNDNQAVLIHLRKSVDKLNPRVEFEIKEL